MIEWWWIRHAPVMDPGETLYGRTDLPADISEPTVALRLQRLAMRLPEDAVWIITPLQRTHQTARILAAHKGVPATPSVEAGLIEQDFGRWQGRPRRDVFAALGSGHPFWKSPGSEPFPDGESFADVIERCRTVIDRHNRSPDTRPRVVIGHAGSIRAAIAIALDLTPDTALRLHLDAPGLTRIDAFPADDGDKSDPGQPAGQNERTAWRIVCINAQAIDSNVTEV